MKKKIIFFHLLNNYSGSPRVLADVISITKNKYDIVLITSNSEGFLSNLNVKTIFIKYDWSENKMITLIRFIYAQLNFIFYSFKFLNRNNIFYINTQQPSIVALVAKIIGVNVVFHIHETSISQKYFGKFYKFIRRIVKGYEIFVSNYIYQKEVIDSDRSTVIYNTVSNKILKKSLNSTYRHYINNTFNILMICSLRDYKGIPEFFELAKKFKNDNSIKFNLLVDGTLPEINKYLISKKISDNIKIIPRTNTPEKYLMECSLLLNLSRTDQWIETFGLTILEAMNFGIPCIVPPIGGPIEIVDNGVNGFHISSYDINKISDVIRDLKVDNNKLLKLSKQSKIKSKYFSKEKFQSHIFDFLEKIK